MTIGEAYWSIIALSALGILVGVAAPGIAKAVGVKLPVLVCPASVFVVPVCIEVPNGMPKLGCVGLPSMVGAPIWKSLPGSALNWTGTGAAQAKEVKVYFPALTQCFVPALLGLLVSEGLDLE